MYALSNLFYQAYLIKCTISIEIKDYNIAPAKNDKNEGFNSFQ